jgi:hypothetical protein
MAAPQDRTITRCAVATVLSTTVTIICLLFSRFVIVTGVPVGRHGWAAMSSSDSSSKVAEPRCRKFRIYAPSARAKAAEINTNTIKADIRFILNPLILRLPENSPKSDTHRAKLIIPIIIGNYRKEK